MKGYRYFFRFSALLTLVLMAAGCGMFGERQAKTDESVPPGASQTLLSATGVVQEFTSESGRIPDNVLRSSAGIAVIPSLTRAAFLVGGQYGKGVLVKHENGKWGLPVFMSVSGGSLGLQAGGTSTDLVLVFMNPESVTRIQNGKLDLGADVTLLAGPVGGSADVSTGRADVLAYQRTGGVFAGAAVSGASVSLDPETTHAYYIGPKDTQARGYYGQGGNRLIADLLSLDPKIQNVPRDAKQLQQKLEQLTGTRG